MSRRILITGCATGLGRETALYLARRGMQVYATVRDAAQVAGLEESAAAAGVSLRVLPLDIVQPDSVAAAVETMAQEVSGIDGLVNNAGIGLRGFFEDLAPAEIERLFQVNVLGTMNVTRAVLPTMRQARSGHILIITSVAGYGGSIGVSAYCATKFAQEGFGESLAMELAPFGIRVSLVAPAIVKTERWSVNRAYAARAFSPESPYTRLFERTEKYADRMVATSTVRPFHVAETIYTALTAPKPRIRYMVGRRARFYFWLRRIWPAFETMTILGPAQRLARRTGLGRSSL